MGIIGIWAARRVLAGGTGKSSWLDGHLDIEILEWNIMIDLNDSPSERTTNWPDIRSSDHTIDTLQSKEAASLTERFTGTGAVVHNKLSWHQSCSGVSNILHQSRALFNVWLNVKKLFNQKIDNLTRLSPLHLNQVQVSQCREECWHRWARCSYLQCLDCLDHPYFHTSAHTCVCQSCHWEACCHPYIWNNLILAFDFSFLFVSSISNWSGYSFIQY